MLREINLFSNPNRAVEDEQNLQLQYLSTRIYMILLVLALIILSFYSSLTYTTKIETVDISTIDDYINLKNKYNGRSSVSKFECLCQTLSISHSSYIHQLEPSFHEICSSYFVSNEWLQILFESYIKLDYSSMDIYTFPGTAFAKYQALAMMCSLVKESIDLAQTLFLNSIYITSGIIDQDQFEENTMRDIKQFQKTMPNNFIHVLKLVRGLSQANGLVSAYSTNWKIMPVFNLSENGAIISYDAQYYEECNCATEATCHQRIENSIPGYIVGCVPLESLLQSTIECHYNLSCIQLLYSYITDSNSSNVIDSFLPLNGTYTHFPLSSTVAMLAEEMFIESWSSTISYNDFFDQCHPSKCSITFIERLNPVFMFTTITGIYGGLSRVLRLISPFMAKILNHFFIKRRATVFNIQSIQADQ